MVGQIVLIYLKVSSYLYYFIAQTAWLFNIPPPTVLLYAVSIKKKLLDTIAQVKVVAKILAGHSESVHKGSI